VGCGDLESLLIRLNSCNLQLATGAVSARIKPTDLYKLRQALIEMSSVTNR
jgi:hypothetical protein